MATPIKPFIPTNLHLLIHDTAERLKNASRINNVESASLTPRDHVDPAPNPVSPFTFSTQLQLSIARSAVEVLKQGGITEEMHLNVPPSQLTRDMRLEQLAGTLITIAKAGFCPGLVHWLSNAEEIL